MIAFNFHCFIGIILYFYTWFLELRGYLLLSFYFKETDSDLCSLGLMSVGVSLETFLFSS